MVKKYEITKLEYERIRRHSFNLYSAIEEMQEDFLILYNTLEKIEKRLKKQEKAIKEKN